MGKSCHALSDKDEIRQKMVGIWRWRGKFYHLFEVSGVLGFAQNDGLRVHPRGHQSGKPLSLGLFKKRRSAGSIGLCRFPHGAEPNPRLRLHYSGVTS